MANPDDIDEEELKETILNYLSLAFVLLYAAGSAYLLSEVFPNMNPALRFGIWLVGFVLFVVATIQSRRQQIEQVREES